MKRFSVYIPHGKKEDIKIWLDTGFVEYIITDSNTGSITAPDLIFWRAGRDPETCWQAVVDTGVAVFSVLGRQPVSIPGSIRGGFALYEWTFNEHYFLIGSLFESRPAAPEWQAYQTPRGILPEFQMIKAVSDTLYRYLLQEVFRDTQEWCGHTFSVLGPF